MKIIAGEYTGIALSEVDLLIYQKRIGSNCFVLENYIYDRDKNQLFSNDNICVIDYHDGEYVNFKSEKQ